MGHVQLLKILSGLLWVCDAFPKDGCLSKLLFRYGIISTLCIKFFILSSLKVKMELREMKHKMQNTQRKKCQNRGKAKDPVTSESQQWWVNGHILWVVKDEDSDPVKPGFKPDCAHLVT